MFIHTFSYINSTLARFNFESTTKRPSLVALVVVVLFIVPVQSGPFCSVLFVCLSLVFAKIGFTLFSCGYGYRCYCCCCCCWCCCRCSFSPKTFQERAQQTDEQLQVSWEWKDQHESEIERESTSVATVLSVQDNVMIGHCCERRDKAHSSTNSVVSAANFFNIPPNSFK